MKKLLLLFFGLLMFFVGSKVYGQVITTAAGNGTSGFLADGGLAFSTEIASPFGIVVNTAGDIIFADEANNRIRMISPCGIISTIAGNGIAAYFGDGGNATDAQINNPTGIALDASGNIYFSDGGNHRIRKINTSGVISLVAGNGISGNTGDGLAATNANISIPYGIVVDASNNIYFSDKNNNRVRKISSTGIITNFAGSSAITSGSTGDGFAATAALLNQPNGLAIDASGNIYIADQNNHKVRVVSTSSIISTVAGTGSGGNTGDSGPATNAKLNNPTGVFVDATGNLFIADQSNNKIRIVASGTIQTFCGMGSSGSTGDNGLATAAKLNSPYSIFKSSDGNLYISDYGNNRIRKVFNNHSPVFVNGHNQNISLCGNSIVSINNLLTVHDTDGGQPITWSILHVPIHGSVIGGFSAVSTGCGNIIPTGLTYSPSNGYSGADSFKIKVTDGILSDSINIIVNINPLPNAGTISGNSSVCLGITDTLSASVTGGIWSITNSKATLTPYNIDTAFINSISNGIDTVIYTITSDSGCISKTIKVIIDNPYVSPIDGFSSNSLCTGPGVIVISDSVNDGTWSSSDNTVALLSQFAGIIRVKAVGAGTAIISYTVNACGTSVAATKSLTIYATPDPGSITGSTIVCPSSTTTLSDLVTGGIWSCSNNKATISSGGVVSAVSSGLDTVIYTVVSGICSASTKYFMAIAPYLGNIVGANVACTSGITATTLSETVPAGTWISSDTTIAKIDSITGIITSIIPGTVTITYALNYGSCGIFDSITKNITINNPPAIPSAILGLDTVCQSSTIKLADTTLGGIWSKTSLISGTTIAQITGTDSALVQAGAAGGSILVSYTVSSGGCSNQITKNVIIKPYPIVPAIIGSLNTCIGINPTTLSNTNPGGIWVSANTTIATVASFGLDSAVVHGLIAGTSIISYSVTNNCGTTTVTKTVTVNSLPVAGVITGSTVVCQGATDSLHDAVPGGNWYHNNSSTYVSITGVVFGMHGGVDTIKYTVNSAFCNSATALQSITVNPYPLHGSIIGSSYLCTGDSIILKDTTFTGNGVWKSLKTDTATVTFVNDTFGVVHAVGVGKDTIRFIVTNSCGTDSTYKVVSTYLTPKAGTIFGDSIVCIAGIDSLKDITANNAGTLRWWRTNSKVSINTITGVFTGVAAGIDTIMYYNSSFLCGSDTAYWYVDVKPLPSASFILGLSSVCVFSTITLTDNVLNGTKSWMSIHPTIASVNASNGIVTGNHQGTDSILCIATSAYCGADTVVKVITVNPNPYAGTINAQMSNVCIGANDTLRDVTTGCIWGIYNGHAKKDTFTLLGIPTCVVTGLSAGVDTIKYTSTNVCGTAFVTYAITVDPLANAGKITGSSVLCQNDTLTYVDTVAGGNWYILGSSATITINGKVEVDTIGIDTILYTKSNNCNIDTVRKIITISPSPYAGIITGLTKICVGSDITLTDTTSGGIWKHTNTFVTVDNAGIVKGVAGGVDTVKYIFVNSCGADTVKKVITVSPLPVLPSINTRPPYKLCSNTLYQNIGTNVAPDSGSFYAWSVKNGDLFATGKNRQYCLVNFLDTGKSYVKLTVTYEGTGCYTTDSILVIVDTGVAPVTNVIFVSPEFFCLDNSATNFQWGYDDASTKDSTILAGEIFQNYYNPSPDFYHNNYWVVTSYGNCYQKTYYNAPLGSGIISTKAELTMDIFPNPAKTEFNIRVSGTNSFNNFTVKLIDLTGKELKTQQLTDGKGLMNIGDFSSGLYMVILEGDGLKILTKTIVKY